MTPLVVARRPFLRAAFVAAIAASAVGCSADTTRLGSNPFSQSVASNNAPPADMTSSLPTRQVEAQQLPAPPAYPNVAATGAPRPSPVAPYRPAPLGAQQAALPRTASNAQPNAANAGIHVVAPGETISAISRLYGKPVAVIARANGLATDAKLRVGQRVAIPGVTQAQIRSKPGTSQVAQSNTPAPPAPAAAKPQPAPKQVASLEPAASVNLATPATEAAPEAQSGGGTPTFRWPVRGRVISGFGAKSGGQNNDGINLSVPEGTSVKASEDGVVAYAGNELKGYGNLVLVRHSGGFVTAYAHASEVMVKRGDRVKRGQIIARAGQTGNVNAPQLHFEIRKGSTPIDPMQFLHSARADL